MAAPMALPGLVGSAAQWRHACRKVEEAFRAGEWLAVAGEDGVGKLALLQAVHLRRFPVGVATRCSTHARRPSVPKGCRRFAASSGRASDTAILATWTASTPGPLAACARMRPPRS